MMALSRVCWGVCQFITDIYRYLKPENRRISRHSANLNR
ncbi:hypothetical protein JEU22_11915 [Pseudomonas putida]|uniref:Uncharacterized protein n=1 Tax=Pseudomonas putida TaxID=303 RepID=A0A8I1EEK7_PSEPU|nr:hypothetical protein [Pseudomonas putida]